MAAIEEACERGCLDYEMGESGGVSSLERFKQKLGGEPRRIAEYRVERLPLSKLQDSFAFVVGRLEALAINRGLGST